MEELEVMELMAGNGPDRELAERVAGLGIRTGFLPFSTSQADHLLSSLKPTYPEQLEYVCRRPRQDNMCMCVLKKVNCTWHLSSWAPHLIGTASQGR